MCGKSEMRNRLRHESHVKTSQELEELRIICFEEANQVRRLQIKELSVRQERDPNLLKQIQELQDRVNSFAEAT